MKDVFLGQLDEGANAKFGSGEVIKTDLPPSVPPSQKEVQAPKFAVPYADEAAQKPSTPRVEDQLTPEDSGGGGDQPEPGGNNGFLILGGLALLYFLFKR